MMHQHDADDATLADTMVKKIITAASRKKLRVIVVGDSTLKVVHVGASDIDSSSPENIKKDYRALGEVVSGSGAQIVFSSILQDTGEYLKKGRRISQVNKWLEQWCQNQGFGYLEHGTQFGRTGLLEAGGAGLTTKGKSRFGSKQEELETCAGLQGYDIIDIAETWWDGSYDWSVGMEGYRLFRKDRPGRHEGGVALYVRNRLESMKLCLGTGDQLTEFVGQG
ncbi:uncharacterized protein LOC133224745 [Neopsephotus bourkii]|uniref:uncharacterized protein LOC133224745 n=1 Tax=Neopsephotus bourkii TaxID=309878 RepID=UPI002AA5A372|nr:uncharacterized protein LOC133224745 [Neopsephotus bourkii]